jgi:hypothetical protein
MSRSFLVTQKIDLSHIGEGWDGCHLSFKALTLKDLKDISGLDPEADTDGAIKSMVTLLKKHFVSGEAMMTTDSGDGKMSVEAGDLDNLPVTIITTCIKALAGSTDPKS